MNLNSNNTAWSPTNKSSKNGHQITSQTNMINGYKWRQTFSTCKVLFDILYIYIFIIAVIWLELQYNQAVKCALLGNELCHALPKSSSDSHHQDTKIPWRRSANGGSLVVMLRKHLLGNNNKRAKGPNVRRATITIHVQMGSY